jgi:hypothetical protein
VAERAVLALREQTDGTNGPGSDDSYPGDRLSAVIAGGVGAESTLREGSD